MPAGSHRGPKRLLQSYDLLLSAGKKFRRATLFPCPFLSLAQQNIGEANYLQGQDLARTLKSAFGKVAEETHAEVTQPQKDKEQNMVDTVEAVEVVDGE